MVVGSLDAEWLEGRIDLDLANKNCLPVGMFPKAYVQLESKGVNVCEALYEFVGRTEQELSFKAGAIISFRLKVAVPESTQNFDAKFSCCAITCARVTPNKYVKCA